MIHLVFQSAHILEQVRRTVDSESTPDLQH